MSDYEKELDNVSRYPVITLGQEVETQYEKGIFVSASMPHNRL